MEYTILKNSDLKVSRLGMGGCPMGGYGWGHVEDVDFVNAVYKSLDLGINLFDTADIYGLGKSEIILGKALRNHRSDAIIATKFGVRIENGITSYDNSKEWLDFSLHNSLKRLKTDYIDLYQIHYRDGLTPFPEVLENLNKYKEQGKIRFIGLSNISLIDLDELNIIDTDKLVSFQNEFSLANREKEKEINSICSTIPLSPITWGSLGQGILTGKYDENSIFPEDDRRSKAIYKNFHGEKLVKNIEIVNEMKLVAKNHNVSISSVAIRWILDYLKNSVVLTGIKKSSQVTKNCEAFNWHLSKDEIDRLEIISSKL